MTVNELREVFNGFGLSNYPITYDVDHNTYANVCQDIFELKYGLGLEYGTARISLGINMGIMFKGVELILQRDE